MKTMDQLTKCVHAGGYIDDTVGGVTTPVYTSSSYKYKDGGVCYPRYFNIPTQKAVALKIAALENGESALVVSSGMAAASVTLFSFLSAGDHLIVQSDIYGGTYNLVDNIDRQGIEVSFVQAESVDDFRTRIRANTRLILFETPSNPLLKIVDIEAVAKLGREMGLITVMDNTFASPINQTPLDLGIDIVIHSATKYMGGHSDLCAGAIVCRSDLMDRIYETAVNIGVVLNPSECYRLERSLKTLGIRVKQQNENAMALAEFLDNHEKVKNVYFPGLSNHPNHETAEKQMHGFGGMLSFEIENGSYKARRLVENLKLFTHAVSLGGVESLVCFPTLTSHEKMPHDEREKLGITDSLIRVSCGIEETEDLINDMRNALDAI